ncbi:D-alanine--poly(phosphoribitol) ligase [Massilia aquatica]|uniref:D-alanine--poly(Phosphoribitol) ligase n=1 Tax=Massilia aquatica TaxID=2609000 RepID=A0ABX0MD04_9BURK|nr:D-alanine--poly(phosphoribitol) ligase [Massilia aquatica]NHZ44244.1 D-alanine--poly(phosphoribitol) ligase [Massilia aquatica]
MSTPTFTPVIDYLRTSAQEHPDRLAFVDPDAISYRQFYQAVRQRAAHFARHGTQPGDRVAIWLPKCREYALSLYAAMEIGAVYVPLDGTQPAQRARKILDSAEPAVLVTDAAHFRALDGWRRDTLKLVLIVDDAPCDDAPLGDTAVMQLAAMAPPVELPPPCAAGVDDLAAILFTSGSTGVPKGVRISYANLHSFIAWALAELKLTPHDVVANHAGFHFDLSTFDYFAAAAVGAAVWIVREDEQRDLAALIAGIRRHQVSIWYSVPSALALLAGSGELTSEVTASLRHVLFAGEVFPIRQLRALKSCLPAACALYNLYGPTETNVCLYYQVRDEDMARDKPVCIGSTLPGVMAKIVDADGQPVSGEGAIGELLVSGACVTPGYWRRQEPENHINHLHGRHATGDLVGIENGLLYYHGRKDRMLKLNGNRIELGEIEAVLGAMPGIAEVAVVAACAGDTQHLVACYTLRHAGERLGVLDIKRYCGARLPRYMIPRLARQLEALPKNANGKIDYRALEQLTRGTSDSAAMPHAHERNDIVTADA